MGPVDFEIEIILFFFLAATGILAAPLDYNCGVPRPNWAEPRTAKLPMLSADKNRGDRWLRMLETSNLVSLKIRREDLTICVGLGQFNG